MLPLGLLNAAQGHPMLVELKNGETLNGHLVLCDTWMNLTLREVVQTSPEGDKFVRLPEVYVKGNNIKYLRVPDEILDIVKDQQQEDNTTFKSIPTWRWPGYSVPFLLGHLGELTKRSGQRRQILELAQHLRNGRVGPEDEMRVLEALVMANADTAGSVTALQDVLKELGEKNIQPDSSLYHAALVLLSVHPDYLTRRKILNDMKSRGIPLLAEGKVSVALGLLRDGQDEMALDYLEEMIRDAVVTPVWVFDIFIFVLGGKGFVEEAMRLMLQRLTTTSDGGSLSTDALWYFLLDQCSAAFYYQGTKYIWDNMVLTKSLTPSDGAVAAVLETAARHGDLDFAKDAIQTLSQRSVKLNKRHYEALIECYLQGSDPENALRVLAIMCRAGITNLMSSTKSIRHFLEHSPLSATSISLLPSTLRETPDFTPEAEALVIDVLCTRGELRLAVRLFQDSQALRTAGQELLGYYQIPRALLLAPFKHDFPSAEDVRLALSTVDGLVTHYAAPAAEVAAFFRCYVFLGDVDSSFECLQTLQEKNAVGDALFPVESLVRLMELCLTRRDPRVWGLFDLFEQGKLDTRDVADRLQQIQTRLHSMRTSEGGQGQVDVAEMVQAYEKVLGRVLEAASKEGEPAEGQVGIAELVRADEDALERVLEAAAKKEVGG
ncbi:hypothetical protein B0T16DRAFT_496294 [Cercophora newfieldiana]|uniref:Sm domain-containing protein n=1 Tax=Cercophora newfieldiana TaxID=92897 RepID=A0AA39XWM6_9PEZI|nr:hypothetical protein B0T16DRAFT_496294 [Cercophora newfieldiana]